MFTQTKKSINYEEKINLTEQIRSLFYNYIANHLIDQLDVTQENLDEKFKIGVIALLNRLLNFNLSKPNNECLYFLSNVPVHRECCSEEYYEFFDNFLCLKKQFLLYENDFMNTIYYPELDNQVVELAELIIETSAFHKIIPMIKQFILESKNINIVISSALIRESFYYQMVNTLEMAVEEKLISPNDLKDRDPYIYFACPALTILRQILTSANKAGIVLLYDKILTIDNCPKEDDFYYLLTCILPIKNNIQKLDNEELEMMKYMFLSHDKEIPISTTNSDISKIGRYASIINGVASQITQRTTFKNTIDKVIDRFLKQLEIKEKNAFEYSLQAGLL